MSGISQSTGFALVLQALIVGLILRRSYQMARGTGASTARLLALPVFLLLIFVLEEYQAAVLVPWTVPAFTVLDGVIVVGGTLLFSRWTESRVDVFRDARGRLAFRIGLLIPVVYVALFLARIAIEFLFFPALVNFGTSASAIGSPPYSSQVVLVLVDALFATSTGLLTGRTLAVLRKIRAFEVGERRVGSNPS